MFAATAWGTPSSARPIGEFRPRPASSQTATVKEGQAAESVFIAGQFVLAARELADIARHRGLENDAQSYFTAAARMEATVLEHGWDGAWFLRAYDDLGNRVGSRECEEGQIYVESQGLCLLAGIGLEDGRAAQALESVRERLATKRTPVSFVTTIRGL